MRRAGELLSLGSLSVNEVAKAVGYVNISHFYKAFKKAYGISPGAYQKNN
jgi:YesN/AraC family two-component response regulator